MAFEKETIRNEVLLRFGEKGENRGKLIGASQTSLAQVLEDGAIISSRPLDPEQLSALPGQSGTPLAEVLGEITAQTIIDNQLLVSALTAEQATNEELNAALVKTQASVNELSSALDHLQGQFMLSEEALAASQAEVQRLTDLLGRVTTNELDSDSLA